MIITCNIALEKKNANEDSVVRKGHSDSVIESLDGKSRIKPVTISSNVVEAIKQDAAADQDEHRANNKKRGPVLIVGFPGVGLVGSICANYIIEKKNLHQIAFVDSEYVVPSAIYIGGKLRHPFRIYADDTSTLCVMVCEAPLRPDGVHSIMDMVVAWALRSNISELLILDGMPVRGLPAKNRKPVVLSSSSPADAPKDHSVKGAMMVGLSGGLISACLSDGMSCTAVLIPSTSGIPDPEGAAILLETISRMPTIPLEIDVEPLRHEGQIIKKQLKEFIDSVRKEQQEEEDEGKGRYLRSSRIYG